MHHFAPCSTSGSNPADVPDLVKGGLVPDGYNPFGSLLYANAMLYGMTRNGGKHGGGVIFMMNPDPGCAGQLSASVTGYWRLSIRPKTPSRARATVIAPRLTRQRIAATPTVALPSTT